LFTIVYQKHREGNSDIDNKINKIKQYIDEHYNQEITLEELSALAAITPQYLCRLFKKYFDLRPFQYITRKRIQQAKKLLSDNTLSVNEIAHSVGFNDCSYFCAIFKKNEMMSPTEFRGQ
jgi:YesN/AraC family two-component response regulator